MKNTILKLSSLLTILLFFLLINSVAQNVGINASGNNPDSSAMLDIASNNKGLLIPQVGILSLTDAATIAAPAHSLLVYNTNTGLPGGKGYYYNAGTTVSASWVKLVVTSELDLLAPKASPTFSGTVVLPSPFTMGAVSMTASGTQLNYLNSATGTTGTASANLVFSASPLFTSPRLASSSTSGYVWTATDANGNGSFQAAAGGTGVTTMAAIGSSANANGASISGNTLTLQPASASFGGLISTGAQTIAGAKNFTGDLTPEGRLMLPMGELSYFNMTGTVITISGMSNGATNMVKAGPATTLSNDMGFDNGGANNGRLRYTGTQTRTFHIAFTFSATPSTNNDVFVMAVAKNGVIQDNSKVLGSSSNTQFTALHVMLSLSTNDYIELYIGNTTAARNMTVKSLNMFALGM